MQRFAANISLLYPDLSLEQRIAAAARRTAAGSVPYAIDATEFAGLGRCAGAAVC
jgi:hydroxypyruvate isomerase